MSLGMQYCFHSNHKVGAFMIAEEIGIARTPKLLRHRFGEFVMSKKSDDAYEYIFVTSFFHKKLGKRIYANQCGKKAFRIRVKRK